MGNEKKIYLLVQQTAEAEVFWGGQNCSAIDKKLLDGCPDIEKRSAAYAFKEIELQQHPTDYEITFAYEIEKILKQQALLEDDVSTHLMTVGHISKKKGVELIPNDCNLEGRNYWLSWSYYNAQDYDWKPLFTGNQIMVTFDESNATDTYCIVQKIVTGAEENKLRVQRKRMTEDLMCMAGHVSVVAEISEYRESVMETGIYKNLFLSLNGIRLADNLDLRFYPKDILGNDFSQGRELNVWINPQYREDGGEPYIVSCNRVNTAKLSHVPTEIPEQGLSSVVGNVISLNDSDGKMNKYVMWVALDNYSWGSPIYRGKIDMTLWGNAIRDYLPLGFPATFMLDYNIEKNQNRLFFIGLSPGSINGRVSSKAEARNLSARVLCERVEVTPYRRKKGEEGFYVTSPGYAGFIADKDAPGVLVEYSKNRVFSTEMKIPARVVMKKSTVVFYITDVLKDEFARLAHRQGQEEPMKICGICLGNVYLTTSGGYPVCYKCKDDGEEKHIRSNMFGVLNFLINNIKDDCLDVRIATNFFADVQKTRLSVGSRFNAFKSWCDSDGVWHCFYGELECRIIPESLHEGELLSDGETLVLVTIDIEHQCLVAIAHHDRFSSEMTQPRRLLMVREISDEVWLCRDGDHFALMETNERGSQLIRSLQIIYGPDISVVAQTLDKNKKGTAACCQFSGVACGGDYRSFLSGNSIFLQVPLSENTPRVLYNDVVVTATPDVLKLGPVQWVIPTGITNENGDFVCKCGQNLSKTGNTENISDIENVMRLVSASVFDVKSSEVIFNVDEHIVVLSHQKQLHIPLDDCAPLPNIFPIGSKWVLKEMAGQYEIYNDCPNEIMGYTLVKKNTRAKKMRKQWGDWLVKNENGAVAVAQVENGKEGDTLLMLFDEVIDDVSYVCETDMEVGYEIGVRIVDQMEGRGVICKPVEKLTLGDNYEIPLELWNWSIQRLSIKNFAPFVGAVCMAKLVEIKDSERICILLDRRSLIPQCELLKGMDAKGEYQMQIVNFREDGYLLRQNNFYALLPFKEASIIHFPQNEILRAEFLKKETLLVVSITMQNDSLPLAKWRSLQGETIERWKEYASLGESQMMKIHHIGTQALYLEFEGAFLYVSSKTLGIWEGQSLSDYYKPNQIVNNITLEWSEEEQVFSTSVARRNSPLDIPTPEVNGVYDAIVQKYHPKMDFCYVSFGQGRWAAKIPAEEFSWIPLPIDQYPYSLGSNVTIKVIAIDQKNLVITASIKACLPKPKTGPIAGDGRLHPEYRWFNMLEKTKDGLILQDSQHVPGLLTPQDTRLTIESLISTINNEGGIWLGIIGVKGRWLHCSQLIMEEAIKNASFEYYKSNGNQEVSKNGDAILVGTILAVKKSKLIVVSGAAMGYIPRKECTGQLIIPLEDSFQVGQNIKFVLTSQTSLRFEASILLAYPLGMRSLLKNVIEGNFVRVKVESVVDERVVARLCYWEGGNIRLQNYVAFIEAKEIVLENEENLNEWVDRWKGEYLNVRCVEIQDDTGYIFCSQKEYRNINI